MPKLQSKCMENKIVCDVFTNIIKEQNRAFLAEIAKAYNLDYKYLEKKYIKPEYYLPIITSSASK